MSMILEKEPQFIIKEGNPNAVIIPIQQSEARTQIVLSEQTMDSFARLMVDRLIQIGVLEERQLEEYLVGTSELGKNLRALFPTRLSSY